MSTTGDRGGPGWLRLARGEHWPTVCVLAMIVASDYKFRLRADNQTIQGQADPFVLLEIAVYAAVAVFLFMRFRPRLRLWRADWVTFLGYGYVAVCLGSALYSPYHALALVRGAQLVVVLALARSIARHADGAAPHRIAHGFAVLVSGSVIFGVVFPFPRLPSQPGRFTWLYIHPVDSGVLLAIAVVLLTGYLLAGKQPRTGPVWHPIVYAALWLICVVGLVATQTRGAAVGAAVGVVVIVCTRWRGIRRLEAILCAALGLGAIVLVASQSIAAFVARGESAQQLSTLNFRTELWSQAFAAFAQHPLYGYGLSASRGLFLSSTGLGGGHNAVVNLLVDTGLLGTAFWVALLCGIALTTIRLRERRLATDRGLVLAVLAGMVANAMFTEGLGAPANVMCTWLFVLLAWATMIRRVSAPEDPAGAAVSTDAAVAR